MEMRAISKYSNITACVAEQLADFALKTKVIQLKSELIGPSTIFFVEFILPEDFELYYKEHATTGAAQTPTKSQEEQDLETALDTVLNNDPRGKYNGWTLRQIFEAGDTEWVDWVLKNMHNEFIKSRVKLIKESKLKGGDKA